MTKRLFEPVLIVAIILVLLSLLLVVTSAMATPTYSVTLPLVYGRATGTIGDPWSWPLPTSAPTMEPVNEYD